MNSETSNARAVIVTALPLEYDAVRSYLTDITESTHHGTVYETGTFTTTTVTWQVTILENTNMCTSSGDRRRYHSTHPRIAFSTGYRLPSPTL